MSRRLKAGKVHVYTGSGKGKTTAAIGLAVRAAGAGLKVCMCQFIKGKFYSELKALKNIKEIKIVQCGRGCFIRRKPKAADIEAARKGLVKSREIIASGRYDVVILDEANIAVKLGLIGIDDIIDIIDHKPGFVELVLTGRGAGKRLVERADYVTQVTKIKHPFDKGLLARRGIEY